MPGLLLETGKVIPLMGGDGIAADSTGKFYNGLAGADASNNPLDTMMYNECYITIQTGDNASGFKADLIASATTTPTDGAVIGSFGTVDNTSMYTAYVYAVGQPRYFFLRVDGTTAAGEKAEISATAMMAHADRPATDASSEVTFAILS
jgi:hypothetical protein